MADMDAVEHLVRAEAILLGGEQTREVWAAIEEIRKARQLIEREAAAIAALLSHGD